MKRPLFCFMLFLISGIISGYYFNSLYICIIFIISVIITFILNKIYNLKIIFSFILSFLIGYTLISNSIKPKNTYIENLAIENKVVKIDGIVKNYSYTKKGKQKIILKTNSISYFDKVFYNNFKVQATLPSNEFVEIGQNIKIEGKLTLLDRKRNLGGFDEFLYLKGRGIEYKLSSKVLEKGKINYSINKTLNKIKNNIISVFDNTLPEKQSGIMKSMIVGDKSDLDDYIVDLYKISGIYHIIVISGIHIAILNLLLNNILNKFLNPRTSAIITLIFIFLYCIMVGSGASVVRAVIMSSIVIIGKLFYRETDFLTSMSFAIILLLFYQPLFLWDVGFEFTFIIVLGIGLGTNIIDKIYTTIFLKIKSLNFLSSKIKFRNALALSTITTIAITPISAYYFSYIMPYSIIANLAIVSTTEILIVLGFLIGFIGIFNLYIAKILSGSVYLILRFYEFICEFFAKLPFATILVGSRKFWTVIIEYFLICFFLYVFSVKKEKFKNKFKQFISFCSLYIILLICLKIFTPSNLEVTFIDVGQGESIFIKLKNEVYLIDGGGWISRPLGENTGIKVVKPFLDSKKVKKIDKVFVTHLDEDHVMGIIELIGKKKIKEIYIPFKSDKELNMYLILSKLCNDYNIKLNFIKDDYKFLSEKGLDFEVIHPFLDSYYTDENSVSLVIKLNYKDISFLFTGDIGKAEENSILNAKKNVSAHVFNLGHHGSKNSNSEEFIDEVNPIIAVASAGANNLYNHPSSKVQDILIQKNIPLYTTSKDGAITIKTNGNKIYIYKMLNR